MPSHCERATALTGCSGPQDDLARCILSPEAFLNLQRSLLPQRLQADPAAGADAGGPPAAAPADVLLQSVDPDREAAALAGIAAAGRVALEKEEQAGPVASGSGVRS